MFISTSQLSKLMKEAYRGRGIRIGNLEEGLVIIGSSWGLWIDENYIPNKVKAIVMELAGTLPAEESVFKVSKGEAVPQYELTLDNYYYINRMEQISKESASRTGVYLDLKYCEYELLQVNHTGKIAMISRKLTELIDPGEIDYNVENEPSGPCTGLSSGMFFWKNATCTLMLLHSAVPEDNPVINILSKIDFEKEVKH